MWLMVELRMFLMEEVRRSRVVNACDRRKRQVSIRDSYRTQRLKRSRQNPHAGNHNGQERRQKISECLQGILAMRRVEKEGEQEEGGGNRNPQPVPGPPGRGGGLR